MMTRTVKTFPWCLILEEGKHWKRLSCCRTTCYWPENGRAWKLDFRPQPQIYRYYLPQTDLWVSHVLPCGIACVSCQTNEGPQSWTEYLDSAKSASTSPHWPVPAWWSLEFGSIILAGSFWMLNPAPPVCGYSLSWKRAQFPVQSSRIGPLDLKIIYLSANKICPQNFFLHSTLNMIPMCCWLC